MIPILKFSIIFTSAAIFFTCWFLLIPTKESAAYLVPEIITEQKKNPLFESHWVSNNETHEVHSASIAISKGKLVAAWYGGTEEGHRDVAIFTASYDQTWSEPRVIANRYSTEKALGRYIRKIGNPSLYAWPDGRLSLYYVSVSFGGWAASSINFIESLDQGMKWTAPSRLVTSPFLNISTLVRTEGLPLAGGGVQLPVYHEFLGKFSELLRLSEAQEVLNKVRISRGKHSLQPALTILDKSSSVGFLRYSGAPPNRLLRVFSENSGENWSIPVKTKLPNPDSAVSVLSLHNGEQLLALNDLEDGRYRLSLAMGKPHDMKIVKILEEEAVKPSQHNHEYQFSYPSMAINSNGVIDMVYTWNKTRIRHLRFNLVWLEKGLNNQP